MDDQKRKFQGVWIPSAIWLDRGLSITEKVMLVEINSLESSDRGCFASNEHFSEFFDLSKSRVSEIISSLADKDLVRINQIRKGKQVVERQIWMTEIGRLLTGVTSSENTKNLLRKIRRTPSENAKNPSGNGDEPPSENTKESNTESNNTLSKPKSNPVTLMPDKSGAQNHPSDTELQAACRATWASYRNSYFSRYAVDPIRNASTNVAIKGFVKKLPYHEAPHVAAFFVSHNDKFYVQKTHAVSLLLKDAEGLRTQWATGRAMTAGKATQLERTSGNADAVREAIEMMNARKNHAAI